MHTSQATRGFTLIEILIGVSILAVVFSIAVPSFGEMIRRNRLASQVNEYVTALNYARSEASKRGLPISVCATNTAQSNCGTASNWTNGWMAFIDNNANGGFDSGETILQQFRAPASGFNFTPTPSRRYVTFRALEATPLSMSITKSGCVGPEKRTVDVAAIGRITLEKENC